MLVCERLLAKPAENVAEPLMGRRRLRIHLERALVQIPREGELIVFEQRIGEIDQRAQIARMMFERFAVGQPCRTAIARVIEERSQVSEGPDVRAVALDDLDVGIFRLIIAPEQIEYAGTRKQQRNFIRSQSEPLLDLGQLVWITERRKHTALYAADAELPRLNAVHRRGNGAVCQRCSRPGC